MIFANLITYEVLHRQRRYVTQFKYLGHMIDNQLYDDVDINRELIFVYLPEQIFLLDALHTVLNRSSCVYFEHAVCVFTIMLMDTLSQLQLAQICFCTCSVSESIFRLQLE